MSSLLRKRATASTELESLQCILEIYGAKQLKNTVIKPKVVAYKVLGFTVYDNVVIAPYEAVFAGFCTYNPQTCVWPRGYAVFTIRDQLYAYLVFDEALTEQGCGFLEDDYRRY